jgi:hypothetical protein
MLTLLREAARGHQNPEGGREESWSAQFACSSAVDRLYGKTDLDHLVFRLTEPIAIRNGLRQRSTAGLAERRVTDRATICGGDSTVLDRARRQFLAAPTAATRRPPPEVGADRGRTVPRGRNRTANLRSLFQITHVRSELHYRWSDSSTTAMLLRFSSTDALGRAN